MIPVVNNTSTYYRTGPGGVSSEVWEDMRAQEDLTKVWGTHTLKGGYEILRTRYNVLAEALPSGKYFMAGTEFPFATAGTTGNDFADLLLGYVGRPSSRRPWPPGCRAGGATPPTCRTTGNRGAT